jgi:hypothetical protein
MFIGSDAVLQCRRKSSCIMFESRQGPAFVTLAAACIALLVAVAVVVEIVVVIAGVVEIVL